MCKDKKPTFASNYQDSEFKDKIETINRAKYLPWAIAWKEFKKVYPNGYYETVEYPDDNGNICLPYLKTKEGYFVKTRLFLDKECKGFTYILPAMDNRNRALGAEIINFKTKKTELNRPANSFDLNTTAQRCLVKNIASCTGIGLYLYAGEDLPEVWEVEHDQPDSIEPISKVDPEPKKETPVHKPLVIPSTREILLEELKEVLKNVVTREEYLKIKESYSPHFMSAPTKERPKSIPWSPYANLMSEKYITLPDAAPPEIPKQEQNNMSEAFNRMPRPTINNNKGGGAPVWDNKGDIIDSKPVVNEFIESQKAAGVGV